MDKVKVAWAVIKKQHFWILTGIMLIASTLVWYMAVGEIESDSQKHLSQIQSTMTEAQNVASVVQHPNDEITNAFKQQTAILKQQIYDVWSQLYDRQRKSVLFWPEALGEKFISHVEQSEFAGPIPRDFRDLYLDNVKQRWDELPAIIDAKPEEVELKAAGGSSVAKTASRTSQALPDWIVIWKDQKDIRRKLLPQTANGDPTDHWVWATQEDLWVYENLLKIVAKTNEGSIGPHNAVISVIDKMKVGQDAAGTAGAKEQRITPVDSAQATAEEASSDSGSSAPAGDTQSPLNNRYIDAVGSPLPNGLEVKKDEMRRIPVQLVLHMDASQISRFILNCANADLPVEIQQVRVNVGSGSSKGQKVVSPTLSAADRTAGRKVPHVEVAMQGVIYIFNPPSRVKLNMEEEKAEITSAADALGTAGEPTVSPVDPAAALGETPETDPASPEATPEAGTEALTPPAATSTETPPADGAAPPTEAAPKSAEDFFEDEDTESNE